MIILIQHVPFETPAKITPWLEAKGLEFQIIHAWEDKGIRKDFWPDPDSISGAIVLGGPMSANDRSSHKWLAREFEWLADCMMLNKPLLGICLGHQILGAILGGTVEPAPEPEIGWFPVEVLPEGKAIFIDDQIEVLHWHGERVVGLETKPGVKILASTAICPNQGFQKGSTWGVQFHLESDTRLRSALCSNCAQDLEQQGRFIQRSAAMLIAHGDKKLTPTLENLLAKVFEGLL